MKKILTNLPLGKTKIGGNKKPIPMELFLSFLLVDVERSTGHLGESNGWTMWRGSDGLIIEGGIVSRVEYLDAISYKKNLDNHYNNFVNPFYLLEILNKEGKKFFLEYYADEIDEMLKDAKIKEENAVNHNQELSEFWKGLREGKA